MYYTVYKITNKVDGKTYIGTHKTRNLDDEYFGSGKHLRRAIKKHGIENFEKEILFVFDNPVDMYAKEGELVNEEFVKRKDTYNLKEGGFGGWDYINNLYSNNHNYRKYRLNRMKQKCKSFDYRKNHSKIMKKVCRDSEWRERSSKSMSRLYKLLYANQFKGKRHTDETKRKMSQVKKGKYSGKNNPQYGTMWITNGEINKKIKKEDNIPEGFSKGRTL